MKSVTARSIPGRAWPALLALLPVLLAACGGEVVEVVGTVERKQLELTAPLGEEIVELPLAVGERARAGDVVVRLDTEVGELELTAAEARVAAAEANLAAAKQELGRVQGLRRGRVATARDLDEAQQGHDEAVALLAERQAQAAQARKHLEDLELRAGADGVVDQLPYEVGERVPAGGVAAVVLAQSEPWVRVWLPARAVTRLAPGAEARVEIEGLEGRLKGRLESISREPQFTPHYALTERERANLVYEARVVLSGAPEELRPGVPATVRLPLGPRKKVEGS